MPRDQPEQWSLPQRRAWVNTRSCEVVQVQIQSLSYIHWNFSFKKNPTTWYIFIFLSNIDKLKYYYYLCCEPKIITETFENLILFTLFVLAAKICLLSFPLTYVMFTLSGELIWLFFTTYFSLLLYYKRPVVQISVQATTTRYLAMLLCRFRMAEKKTIHCNAISVGWQVFECTSSCLFL